MGGVDWGGDRNWELAVMLIPVPGLCAPNLTFTCYFAGLWQSCPTAR